MKLPKFLKQPTAADIRKEQILEADRMALQYEASAEDHQATARQHQIAAEMYRERSKRLMADVTAVSTPFPVLETHTHKNTVGPV